MSGSAADKRRRDAVMKKALMQLLQQQQQPANAEAPTPPLASSSSSVAVGKEPSPRTGTDAKKAVEALFKARAKEEEEAKKEEETEEEAGSKSQRGKASSKRKARGGEGRGPTAAAAKKKAKQPEQEGKAAGEKKEEEGKRKQGGLEAPVLLSESEVQALLLASGGSSVVTINRAPVLTLWGAVVAYTTGKASDWQCSLGWGRALAATVAQGKGQTLGIFTKKEHHHEDDDEGGGVGHGTASGGGVVVEEFLGQQLRVRAGQALQLGSTHRGGEGVVESGAKASDYLHRALGDHYHATTQVMLHLARSVMQSQGKQALLDQGWGLYCRFRPHVRGGQAGWGERSSMDLQAILDMARQHHHQGQH